MTEKNKKSNKWMLILLPVILLVCIVVTAVCSVIQYITSTMPEPPHNANTEIGTEPPHIVNTEIEPEPPHYVSTATEESLPGDWENNIYDTIPVPTPPGDKETLNQLWQDCATDNRKSSCDELFEKSRHISEYEQYIDFASTCGGRVEMLYYVDCSTQIEYQALPPVQVLPWKDKGVRTLCLTINESYKLIEKDFTPIAENLIFRLHVKPFLFIFVENGCDATLSIEVSGQSLAKAYEVVGNRYSGAHVAGTISLTAPGYPLLSKSIEGTIEPSFLISYYEGAKIPYATREDAPYFSTIKSELKDVLREWFGLEFDW